MGIQRTIGLGILFGLGWWFIGLILYNDPNIHQQTIYVWGDQAWTFMKADSFWHAPYDIPGFLNPPWVVFLLTPFAMLPLTLGVLAQMILNFVGLALVMRKYGATGKWFVLAALSPFAFNTMFEINIDWLVVWALLVPPAYSASLLLAKPQNAIGYVLGFRWHELVRWMLIILLLLVASFVIWGDWLSAWMQSNERSPVAVLVNMAPQSIIGTLPSLIIGCLLAIYAWRKHDGVLGIFAGIFFVPYIASYSMLLPFTPSLLRVGNRQVACCG
jgi:hypothetical protein